MKHGDIMGHEFMGEVMEVGKDNKKLKVGDRVVVPFTIVCGECDQCRRGNFSVCERTNRNKDIADKVFGHTTAGLYGYTHLTGGYPGGQAEYVRVPYADVGPVVVPDGLTDEQVLFLGDILPTGWQAAAQCDIQPTDTVAVWAQAGRPVRHPQRRDDGRRASHLHRQRARAPVDGARRRRHHHQLRRGERPRAPRRTDPRQGPEKCIDSVGMEAHAARSIDSMYDRAKQALMMESDRPHVLREMIYVCRPAGIISIPGVYGGLIDKIPFGAAMNKGLTFRMGQTHVNRWTDDLLKRIQEGQIDPSFVITHSVSLEQVRTCTRPSATSMTAASRWS